MLLEVQPLCQTFERKYDCHLDLKKQSQWMLDRKHVSQVFFLSGFTWLHLGTLCKGLGFISMRTS
jgi:hypothetical protein